MVYIYIHRFYILSIAAMIFLLCTTPFLTYYVRKEPRARPILSDGWLAITAAIAVGWLVLHAFDDSSLENVLSKRISSLGLDLFEIRTNKLHRPFKDSASPKESAVHTVSDFSCSGLLLQSAIVVFPGIAALHPLIAGAFLNPSRITQVAFLPSSSIN